jgi:hypothetical protein
VKLSHFTDASLLDDFALCKAKNSAVLRNQNSAEKFAVTIGENCLHNISFSSRLQSTLANIRSPENTKICALENIGSI